MRFRRRLAVTLTTTALAATSVVGLSSATATADQPTEIECEAGIFLDLGTFEGTNCTLDGGRLEDGVYLDVLLHVLSTETSAEAGPCGSRNDGRYLNCANVQIVD